MLPWVLFVVMLQQFCRLLSTFTTVLRDLDHQLDVEVACRAGFRVGDARVCDAFPFEAQGLSALTTRRNLELYFSTRSRNGDARSPNGFSDSNWHIKIQVEPFTAKHGVRLHANDEIEISRWSARKKRSAFASKPNARTFIDTSRNLDSETFRGSDPATPIAMRAASCIEPA